MAAQSLTSPLPIITIIGSLNADLTSYTSRIPNGGETLHANSFKVGSGGKGGNQACACAKLSRSSQDLQNGLATIKMIGAVGKDMHGRMLLDSLEGTGVDVSGIRIREDIETGVAIIIVEETSGENRILLNAGANYTLTTADFQVLPLPLPALIILQLEIPVLTTVQILLAARTQEVEVLLNPAPAVELPADAYVGLGHLIMNETETVTLSGCQPKDLEAEYKLSLVAEIFHVRGVKNVIITLGGRGVFYSSPESGFGMVKAERVEVVDTTAAGDTFVGTYALEVVKECFNLKVAIEKANKAAARTIGKRGAQASIPWANEIDFL
jgi:ribokinase